VIGLDRQEERQRACSSCKNPTSFSASWGPRGKVGRRRPIAIVLPVERRQPWGSLARGRDGKIVNKGVGGGECCEIDQHAAS